MHENVKIQRQTGCGNEKQIESHSGLFTETFKDVRVCEADIECVCVRGRGSKADRPTMKTMVLKTHTSLSFIMEPHVNTPRVSLVKLIPDCLQTVACDS